jgi:hypothetical protein
MKTSNCPNCSGFADAPKSENIRRFTLEGVAHFVPDVWLAGRSLRIGREHRDMKGTETHVAALHDWAGGCAMAVEFERQVAERAA